MKIARNLTEAKAHLAELLAARSSQDIPWLAKTIDAESPGYRTQKPPRAQGTRPPAPPQ